MADGKTNREAAPGTAGARLLICLQLIKEKRKGEDKHAQIRHRARRSGIGNATEDQVGTISRKSCNVLNKLGPTIQWLHSYVTADKKTGQRKQRLGH
jgi:hypothetical protein